MKTFSAVLLFLLSASFSSGDQTDSIRHLSHVFTNVSVIPMDSERILENYTVIVRGNRIAKMGPADEMEVPEGPHVIDGTGKYLIPGLAEMHGHIPPTNPPANYPDYFDDEYIKSTLFLYVAAGITTVRGMLGHEGQLELKEQVNKDGMIGPNLYLAGPSFHGGSINSPEQAIEKVKQQVEEGWDLLKVHPGLTRAEYDAMATTANELGIPFGGHVPAEVGIVHAIEMGQETMDHIDGYTAYLDTFENEELESKMKDIIARTKEAGVWIIPTQALWETILGVADYDAMKNYDELKYIPKAVRTNYHNWVQDNVFNNEELDPEEGQEEAALRMKLLGEMSKAGVKILMGTDAPQLYSVPGFSIHRELPLMAEAGMTPYEVLESGTTNVGEYFSNEDTFGTIAEGSRADLVLVNANPLEDITHLQNHSGVMVRGRWHPKEEIDKKLKEIEDYYARE